MTNTPKEPNLSEVYQATEAFADIAQSLSGSMNQSSEESVKVVVRFLRYFGSEALDGPPGDFTSLPSTDE